MKNGKRINIYEDATVELTTLGKSRPVPRELNAQIGWIVHAEHTNDMIWKMPFWFLIKYWGDCFRNYYSPLHTPFAGNKIHVPFHGLIDMNSPVKVFYSGKRYQQFTDGGILDSDRGYIHNSLIDFFRMNAPTSAVTAQWFSPQIFNDWIFVLDRLHGLKDLKSERHFGFDQVNFF